MLANEQWQDITKQLSQITKHMKMMQVLRDQQVTLEDCMQAQQIDDGQMDPKFDISHQHTIAYKLQNKLVRLPEQLGIQDISRVLANVSQLEACFIAGQPLFCSVYTFSYLYDRKICENNPLLNAVVQSIHTFGSYVYQLIKKAARVKQDDISISNFSFSRNAKSHDQVSQLLLQAQKKFQTQNKKNQDKINVNFILNWLRLRRSIHALAKSMGTQYVYKNQKKIETDMQGLRKRITVMEESKYAGPKELVEGVFIGDLYKTIRCHFGPRALKLVSFQQSLGQLKNALVQIQLILPVPTSVTALKNRIQTMENRAYNSWSKSYIKSNIFQKQNYIFTYLKSEDLITNDINDWVHISQATKQHQKYQNLLKTCAPVISQTLYRLLANKMRWHWQCSKIYEDYNVLIHMANQVDSYVLTNNNSNKELYIASWFYYYGLELMVKQMLVGFENLLYEDSEIKYVLYVLEGVLAISQRNSQIFLKKIDKTILQNFMEQNFNKKMKKKLNDNQKSMFASVLFKKGLYFYIRALFKVVTILHNKNLLPNKFSQTEQIRIKNRFRIFKNILFTKIITYPQYKSKLQQITKKQTQYLNEALQQLKQVKNIYKLFISQFQSEEVQYRQKEDAEVLMKMSVKVSVVVMMLKMNGGTGKKFWVELGGKYPEVCLM